MELKDLVAPKRAVDVLEAELREWDTARQTADLLRPQLLPSEEAAFQKVGGRVQREVAALQAEMRFLGRLDMKALLEQQRPGPAPRWFLYNPMTPCDTIRWSNEAGIVFQALRGGKLTERVPMGYPNPLVKDVTYTTRPILLPKHVREMILKLRAEEITSYVLFEPRIVESEDVPPKPILKPDPALVIEVAGSWFVAVIWDDPAVEDPRALHTLREFYVSEKKPSWWKGR